MEAFASRMEATRDVHLFVVRFLMFLGTGRCDAEFLHRCGSGDVLGH